VGQALEFLKDQYRHATPILALGEAADLVENAGIPAMLPTGEPDPGVLVGRHEGVEDGLPDFVTAIGMHRHHARETDPPLV